MKMLTPWAERLDRKIFTVMMNLNLNSPGMLSENSVKEFKSNLRGLVIEPGDNGE